MRQRNEEKIKVPVASPRCTPINLTSNSISDSTPDGDWKKKMEEDEEGEAEDGETEDGVGRQSIPRGV